MKTSKPKGYYIIWRLTVIERDNLDGTGDYLFAPKEFERRWGRRFSEGVA